MRTLPRVTLAWQHMRSIQERPALRQDMIANCADLLVRYEFRPAFLANCAADNQKLSAREQLHCECAADVIVGGMGGATLLRDAKSGFAPLRSALSACKTK
jgi:hypothetical protein